MIYGVEAFSPSPQELSYGDAAVRLSRPACLDQPGAELSRLVRRLQLVNITRCAAHCKVKGGSRSA